MHSCYIINSYVITCEQESMLHHTTTQTTEQHNNTHHIHLQPNYLSIYTRLDVYHIDACVLSSIHASAGRTHRPQSKKEVKDIKYRKEKSYNNITKQNTNTRDTDHFNLLNHVPNMTTFIKYPQTNVNAYLISTHPIHYHITLQTINVIFILTPPQCSTP